MRTWLLLALLGLVLLVSLGYREGVNSTLAPTPKCEDPSHVLDQYGWCQKPAVPPIPAVCPAGATLTEEMSPGGFPIKVCYGPPGMTAAEATRAGFFYNNAKNKYYKEVSDKCPDGYDLTSGTGIATMCQAPGGSRPTCSSGYEYDIGTKRCKSTSSSNNLNDPIYTSEIGNCNTYWDSAIASWATGSAASPATAPNQCKRYAPSWITVGMAAGTLLNSDGTPTASTKAQAITENQQDKDYDAQQAEAAGYAASTGYAALLASARNTNNGALPSARDVTNPNMDIEAPRSTTGPVFDSDGVFSGGAGMGQGTASSAAAGLTGGNQYGGGGTYDSNGNTPGSGAYGMWRGTKGTSTPPPGNNLPVSGPSWGGRGTLSSLSGSSISSKPAPTLYGPSAGKTGAGSGLQSGYPQTNSQEGQFGSSCTSRYPGDQDLIPNPYLQSSAYSLANGSRKTDPVPFLTDFSAFQS